MKHCQHFRKYFPAGKIPKQEEKSLRQKKTIPKSANSPCLFQATNCCSKTPIKWPSLWSRLDLWPWSPYWLSTRFEFPWCIWRDNIRTQRNTIKSAVRLWQLLMICVFGEHNPSYFSGVCTFIRRYKALQQRTISTPCIASALHMFSSEGESFSGYILSYVYAILL